MEKDLFQESNRRIYIELTNRCNLACSFCPYPGLKSHRLDMELELAKKILDEIARDVTYRIVYFHNLGEPLLYRDLGAVLEHCDAKNIRYGITTNGLLLGKYVGILRDKKIDQLNISFQATRPDLHAGRKTGMSVDSYRHSVVESIKALQVGGFRGLIKIKLLTTDQLSVFKGKRFENIESPGELIAETEKFYFDFTGRKLDSEQRRKVGALDVHRHHKIQIMPNVLIETFPFLSWGNYEQKAWPASLGRCNAIKEQLVILSNGDVVPCCYDIDSDMPLGNIRELDLGKILNGRKSTELQKDLSAKTIGQKRCKNCLGSLSFGRNIRNQWQILTQRALSGGSDGIIRL